MASAETDSDEDCWTGDALNDFLADQQPDTTVFDNAVVRTKRGRGRPRGIAGNRLPSVATAKQKPAEAKSSMAAPKPSAQHTDTDIVLSKFGPIVSMPLVGSDLQRRMKQGLAHALKNKIDYQDPVIGTMFQHQQTSCSVLASFLNVDQKRVQRAALESGCAAVHGGAWLAGGLMCCIDEMLTKKEWRPILFARRLRYDETPSRIRLPKPSGPESTDVFQQLVLREQPKAALPSGIDVVEHAKVLQTELKLYFLVQDVSNSEYVLITQSVPTSLQAVDRTTAECTKACIDATMNRIPELRRVSGKFPFKVHHACTDAYTANIKTEKAMKCQEPEFVNHYLFCSVHRLATSVSAANSIFADDTAGVLSVGLACRNVGSAPKMRAILAEIFEERLVIRHAESPHAQEFQKYREQVYNVFLPVGDAGGDMRYQNLKRRMILNHFLNGNLQQKDIEHFCPFNHCVDEAETRRCFAVYCAWALCPTKPPKYSRGRWTNYDRAVMWTGILAAHHGLLEDVVQRYTGSVSAPVVSPQPQPLPDLPALSMRCDNTSESDDDAWAEVVQEMLKESMGEPQPAAPPPQEDCEADCPAAPVEPGASDDANPQEPTIHGFDWVEFNKRQKAKASLWVKTSPYPRVSIMHQVCSHFLAVMHHFLKISGDEWDSQQAKLQKHGSERSYRVLDCGEMKSLNNCLNVVFESLSKPPQALPDEHHTRNHRNLFFCMVSKGACALHQLLRLRFSNFPYQMFLALRQGWQALFHEPECMLDELSSAFLRHFTKEEHQSDAMVALETLAICSSVDVAQIECQHASNRDFTMLRGRGWVPSLSVVSAKFACGAFKSPIPKTTRRVKKKILKKIRRPGGAWRAFLSATLSGKRWDENRADSRSMTDLAAEYRALSAADKAYYLEIGHLATISGQHGHVPFGERTKKLTDVAKTLAQGSITETGAIVLGDGKPDLALIAFCEQPFSERYSEFVSCTVLWYFFLHCTCFHTSQPVQ